MPGLHLDWTAEHPELFTAKTGGFRGRFPIQLSAEALQDGTWVWAARYEAKPRRSLAGRETVQAKAMQKAETAARMLMVTQAISEADNLVESPR